MPKKNVKLSWKEKSLEDIWSWYEDQVLALHEYKNKILNLLNSSTPIPDLKFQGFTIVQLDRYFDTMQEELEQLFCLDIVATTEGILKKNYFNRVYRLERKYQTDNSGLSKLFRQNHNLRKINGTEERVRLNDDIIENWKKFVNPSDKDTFGKYLGILHYRNWIAHGLYWESAIQKYLPNDAYKIAKEIFRIVNA